MKCHPFHGAREALYWCLGAMGGLLLHLDSHGVSCGKNTDTMESCEQARVLAIQTLKPQNVSVQTAFGDVYLPNIADQTTIDTQSQVPIVTTDIHPNKIACLWWLFGRKSILSFCPS